MCSVLYSQGIQYLNPQKRCEEVLKKKTKTNKPQVFYENYVVLG